MFLRITQATVPWRASMSSIRVPAWALSTLGSALLLVTGCDQIGGHSDTEFARAALERNPELTIVASDAEAKTFTVQKKGSNELHVVRVDEVIGTVPSTGEAPRVSESAAPPAVAEATPPAPASEPATANSGEPAAPVGAPAAAATGPQGSGQLTKSSTGEVLASIGSKGEGGASVPAAEPGAAAAAENAATAAGANKRLLASGPGYSITAGEPRGNRQLRLAEATELKSPVNVQVERRYEPIICQGNRLVQIDGRNLEFEGDAVAALDGCEIH